MLPVTHAFMITEGMLFLIKEQGAGQPALSDRSLRPSHAGHRGASPFTSHMEHPEVLSHVSPELPVSRLPILCSLWDVSLTGRTSDSPTLTQFSPALSPSTTALFDFFPLHHVGLIEYLKTKVHTC